MNIKMFASSILAAAMLAGPVHAEAPRGMDHHVRPMSGHVQLKSWNTNSTQRFTLAPRTSYPFHIKQRRHEQYQTEPRHRRHHDSGRHHDTHRRHHESHYDRHARRHHRHYDSSHRDRHYDSSHRYRHYDSRPRNRYHDSSHRDRYDRKHDHGHHRKHHRKHYGPHLVQDGLTLKLFSNGRVSAKIRLRSGEHWTRSNEHVVVHGGNRVIVYDSGLRLRGQRYVKRGSHLELGTDRIVIKYGRYSDIYDYRLRLQKRERDRHAYGFSMNIR